MLEESHNHSRAIVCVCENKLCVSFCLDIKEFPSFKWLVDVRGYKVS
jgi:hypothetical protein